MTKHAKVNMKTSISALAAAVTLVCTAGPGQAGACVAPVSANAGPVCESLAQPATELVMPFDATAGKASYAIVSNPAASSPGGGAKVTTHWVFWGEDCNELADYSVCLTERDTIVVDPTNMTSVDQSNDPNGPKIDLTGHRGLVTVTAYETDQNCRPFRQTGEVLSREGIVGTFTVADTQTGYSFGNDALGLNTDRSGYAIALPAHPTPEAGRYVLQTLNPKSLDASLVVMANLRVKGRVAEPTDADAKFHATFHDTQEIATSLPDVGVDCLEFRYLACPNNPGESLIPEYAIPASSGILSLTPASGAGDEYLYAVIGEAVGIFGASSNGKIQLGPPASPCGTPGGPRCP